MVAGGLDGSEMLTSTGIGLRAANAETAASSPRSVSTAGWMPRTRLRRSETARFESSWARSTAVLRPVTDGMWAAARS